MTDVDRPNPLKDVAAKVGMAVASLMGIVGALVQFGVWTAAQGQAVTDLGNALPGAIEAVGVVVGGLVPLASAVWAAFHVAARGKDQVTPVASPRDNDGNPLVPVVPTAGRHYSDDDL